MSGSYPPDSGPQLSPSHHDTDQIWLMLLSALPQLVWEGEFWGDAPHVQGQAAPGTQVSPVLGQIARQWYVWSRTQPSCLLDLGILRGALSRVGKQHLCDWHSLATSTHWRFSKPHP